VERPQFVLHAESLSPVLLPLRSHLLDLLPEVCQCGLLALAVGLEGLQLLHGKLQLLLLGAGPLPGLSNLRIFGSHHTLACELEFLHLLEKIVVLVHEGLFLIDESRDNTLLTV
jgi:hypothetical protein